MTLDAEQSDRDKDDDTPPALILPTAVERAIDESNDSLGSLGRPFDHRSPFFVGMNAAFGVAVAYLFVRGIADITTVIVVIGLALFIAIGLNPVIEFLVMRGLSRWIAVGIVTLGFVVVIGGFVLSAASPISHEVQTLVKNYPHYKANIAAGKGWAGRLAVKLHLTGYLNGKSKIKIPAGGALRAGK